MTVIDDQFYFWSCCFFVWVGRTSRQLSVWKWRHICMYPIWLSVKWLRRLEILGCACRSLGWTFWKPFRILYTITFSLNEINVVCCAGSVQIQIEIWKRWFTAYTGGSIPTFLTFSLIGIVRNKVVVWVSFLNVINYCYGYQLWAIKLLHTTPGLAEVFHPLQSNLIWKQGYIKDNIWHLHSLSTDEIRWSKVNWSVRKIYILRPNRDQLRKMQLHGQQILNNKYE